MNWMQKVATRALKFAGVHPSNPSLIGFFHSPEPSTGIWVTEQTSLNCSAVWAAVRLIAETSAMLPFILCRHLEDGGSEVLNADPRSKLLNLIPNPEMISFTLRETMQSHALLWGNSYAEIERDRAGRPIAYWPLTPNRVTPRRADNGKLSYRVVLPDGGNVNLPPENVLHIHGPGFDGLMGYSVIGVARQSMGLTLATERFGASLFGSGTQPGGVLTHPSKLSDPAKQNLRESWELAHKGLTNAHRIAILEEGLKFEATSLPPEDAQFLQTRKFQVTEVARWFNIPPHMLRDLERATFSNIEHQALEFVTLTLHPWFVRWQQELARKTLLPNEQVDHYYHHVTGELLSGDRLTRYKAHAIAKQNGWMSSNDIRKEEGMNPIPDDQGGNVYLMQTTTQPLRLAEEDDATTQTQQGTDGAGVR